MPEISNNNNLGELVISLDFELLWGVADHSDVNSYGNRIAGGRKAIPKILELFEQFDIHATWAAVGFLFAENKDELIESMPQELDRPQYQNPKYSSYSYLDNVGQNEKLDPYHFGMSLIEQINQTPGQEIATHTFSHCYCLEDGMTPDAFEKDLIAAKNLAARRKIDLKTIVFPRNQYDESSLAICEKLGIIGYRGNPNLWAYHPSQEINQSKFKRAWRLIDAHMPLSGLKTYKPSRGKLSNIPASQFLRPPTGSMSKFRNLHLQVVKKGMTQAAKSGEGFHLWWHPHNFGNDMAESLRSLSAILQHFSTLQDQYGIVSRSMDEAACA